MLQKKKLLQCTPHSNQLLFVMSLKYLKENLVYFLSTMEVIDLTIVKHLALPIHNDLISFHLQIYLVLDPINGFGELAFFSYLFN